MDDPMTTDRPDNDGRRGRLLMDRLRSLERDRNRALMARSVIGSDIEEANSAREADRCTARKVFESGQDDLGQRMCGAIDSRSDELAQMQSMLGVAEKRIQSLNREITTLKAELDAATDRQVKEEVRRMLPEISSVSGIDAPAPTAESTPPEIELRIDAARSLLKRTRTVMEDAEAAKAEISNGLARMTLAEEALRRRSAEQDHREAELARRAEKIARTAAASNRALEEAKKLQEELGEPAVLMARLRKVVGTHPRKQEFLDEASRCEKSITAAESEIGNLRKRLASANSRAKRATENRQRLLEEASEAEAREMAATGETDELRKRVETARTSREDLEAEADGLRAQLSREEAATAKLESKKSDLEEWTKTAEKRNARLRAEAEKLGAATGDDRIRKLTDELMELIPGNRSR